MMNPSPLLIALLVLTAFQARAQEDVPAATRLDFRYSLAVIDDFTTYPSLRPSLPTAVNAKLDDPAYTLTQNQALVEPALSLRYKQRWVVAASGIGNVQSFHGLSAQQLGLAQACAFSPASCAELSAYTGNHARWTTRESYVGLSAGDFDFTAGRRMVRWSNGYAFAPAGVLDPPRSPTNPTDRLGVNQGRDMIKIDFTHQQQGLQIAWSSAMLAPAGSNSKDTAALRYNALVRGFDASLIYAFDRNGDGSVGALTFTRVLGQAWEIHSDAVWRQQAALLLGGKYTTSSGVTWIGEYFTRPDIAYYRNTALSPGKGRQHYAFLNAAKSRLRELPEWKQWDLSAMAVSNLTDGSMTVLGDATRRFGNHVSAYTHAEFPLGRRLSEYGSTPYFCAVSAGLRFQL